MRLHSTNQKTWATRLAAATLAACVLAGCSSSGGGPAKAADTGPGLQLAQAYMSQVSKRPTGIPISEKITKRIPAGKTVAYINCGTPACVVDIKPFRDAATLLKWKLQVLNTDGSASQINNAWQQILRDRPSAVVYSGTPRATFEHSLTKAASLGIKVVAFNIADPVGNGIDFEYGNGDQLAVFGRMQAAYVATDSGANAKTLYVNVPQFPILTATMAGYQEWFPKYCAGCDIHVLSEPNANVGTPAGTTPIVAYLRSHPDTKYVVTSLDAVFTGLPAALRAAGLTKVKIIGAAPTSTNMGYLASGDEAASAYLPIYLQDYVLIDALARIFSGSKLVDVPQQTWLLQKGDLPNVQDIVPVPSNMNELFADLWNVSA